MYNLLFRAAADTLIELASDPTYLGARIGMTAVLHTGGQNLMYHPHLHVIVPGGGLTPTGTWQPSRKKFFIPVKVHDDAAKIRGRSRAVWPMDSARARRMRSSSYDPAGNPIKALSAASQ